MFLDKVVKSFFPLLQEVLRTTSGQGARRLRCCLPLQNGARPLHFYLCSRPITILSVQPLSAQDLIQLVLKYPELMTLGVNQCRHRP